MKGSANSFYTHIQQFELNLNGFYDSGFHSSFIHPDLFSYLCKLIEKNIEL